MSNAGPVVTDLFLRKPLQRDATSCCLSTPTTPQFLRAAPPCTLVSKVFSCEYRGSVTGISVTLQIPYNILLLHAREQEAAALTYSPVDDNLHDKIVYRRKSLFCVDYVLATGPRTR